MLPFVRITGNNPEEQIKEILSYLNQFKETLEFVLMNISVENLSSDLINQLNELGADIKKSNVERENEVAQLSQNTTLTISDVCNSEIFKNEMDKRIANLVFTVNFETGNLEYATS